MASPRFYPRSRRRHLRRPPLSRWLRRIAALALIAGALWLVWRGPEAGGEQVTLGAADSARAVDGDSLELRIAGRSVAVRLDGIDAPELRQSCTRADGTAWPCGAEAMAALAAYALEPALDCTVYAEDRYHRGVATCATLRTADIGAAMVARGLAVATGREGSQTYLREEARAEAQARGLWQGDFTMPVDWRAANPR